MTYCSVVTVLALVGLTKKRFGHYAILKILYLRSPSNWHARALSYSGFENFRKPVGSFSRDN